MSGTWTLTPNSGPFGTIVTVSVTGSNVNPATIVEARLNGPTLPIIYI
jgi:hypothetical protein